MARSKRWQRIYNRRKEILGKIKMGYGCDECNTLGIWFPHTPEGLHFAHLDQMSKSLDCVGKPGTNKAGMGIARLVTKIILTDPVENRKRIKAIFNEIRKCRVLCANHHATETKNRGEHTNNYVIARARLGIPEPPPDTQEDMFYDREEQEMETKRLH